MVGGRWSKFAVLCLFAGFLGGTLAPAAGAEGEPDTGAFNAFNLKGSNGYRVIVWAASGKGYRHGQILILAGRKGEAVTYVAPAKVTDVRVAADLGALGEIDVTFQPNGEEGVEHPVCDRSQRTTYAEGSYVGVIDLHGEEGYTRVRTTSAPLDLHPFIDFVCGVPGSGELVGPGSPGARLRARARFAKGEAIELQANQNRPGARTEVSVSTRELRGRVHIFREVTATYPSSSLEFSPNLGAATLSPPSPFSGLARYSRDAEPDHRWTGNLEVDLPGRSDVSLTGRRFDTGLVHARLTRERPRRAGAARPNLSPWPSTKPSPTAFATSSLLAPT